jgi:hypothetical protein
LRSISGVSAFKSGCPNFRADYTYRGSTMVRQARNEPDRSAERRVKLAARLAGLLKNHVAARATTASVLPSVAALWIASSLTVECQGPWLRRLRCGEVHVRSRSRFRSSRHMAPLQQNLMRRRKHCFAKRIDPGQSHRCARLSKASKARCDQLS